MRSATTYRLAMAAALLLVLLNGWAALRSIQTLLRTENWLAHTVENLRAIDETFVQYSIANSSARASLLTPNPLYLTRNADAERATMEGLDRLQALTADNVSQQQRIAVLRQRVTLKFGSLGAAVAMRHGHGSAEMDPAILDAALADAPDGGISVKYAVSQMAAEEDRLLQDREAEAQAARRHVKITVAGATLLDLVLVVVGFRLLVRTAEGREQLAERAAEILTLNQQLQSVNADLEARVEQRTLELQAANQELEAFSYSVSHDLRAPLRTIDGFSLALEEDFHHCLNDEGQDFIRRVRAGVQRMGTLIDALLQLSRVTRSDIARERVDLSQLATNVFNDIYAGEPNRQVEWISQPGMLAEADPRLLRVAFENLIGNAWKFTARTADARIRFGCKAGENGTVYFIEDNGAGFDMAYVDRLFTAFQRLHGDRDFKGSGIGLATVSRIIRRHHGEIWAESQVGQGATFSFTLASPASPSVTGTSVPASGQNTIV